MNRLPLRPSIRRAEHGHRRRKRVMDGALLPPVLLVAIAAPLVAQSAGDAAWRFNDTVWLGRFDQGPSSYTMYLVIERCDGRTFSGTSRWVDLSDSLLSLEGTVDERTGELAWRYVELLRGGGIVLDGRFEARLTADRRGLEGVWRQAGGQPGAVFACSDARLRPRMIAHVFPAEPPDPATARRIDDLVRELGDPDWRTREQAQAELGGLGRWPEEALGRASADPDPEIRQRAGRLLERLRPPRDFAAAADLLHDFAAHAARAALARDPVWLAELLTEPDLGIRIRAARRLAEVTGESYPEYDPRRPEPGAEAVRRRIAERGGRR